MKEIISNNDHILIHEAIDELERASTGEILTVIRSKSSNFILFRVIFSNLIALIFMYLFLNYYLHSLDYKFISQAFGLYLIIFCLFYYLLSFHFILKYLIPNRVKKHKCEKQATLEFFSNGVYKTKSKTGILIYISILEKEVIVIGDEGINLKIPNNSWDNLISKIVNGIKTNNLANGIIFGLKEADKLLKEHFPIKGEYINEIKQSLIIKS